MKYPKHKLMSTYHLLQHRATKKKEQHYKEKRRAPIPLATTPSMWNFCPGNPQCVIPPRTQCPKVLPMPMTRKPKTSARINYRKSESGIFHTLSPEYSSAAQETLFIGHDESAPFPFLDQQAQLPQQGIARTVEDPVLAFYPG